MQSTKEKVSYCIGLETAKRLRGQFTELDLSCLEKGFLDAVHDEKPKLEASEVQSLLGALQQQVEQQQKAQFAKLAEENKQKGEEFLEKNKQEDGVKALKSGLQYRVLSSGDEKGPHPTTLDTVKVHYRGSLIDGRVFDSSHQRGEPIEIPLAKAIPGWSEILQLMRVGDKWQVFIPAYLAYGEMGFGPAIEPNMTLIFEMELLDIMK